MHITVKTVKTAKGVKKYAQLVQSYRSPDTGKPTHRVLASLNHLDDATVDNLRTALRASRSGQRVMLPDEIAGHIPTIQANLRFLDLRVLHALWHELGLHRLVSEAVGNGAHDVDNAKVIEALVLQRCVAPASKLAATRWFPTTALAHLLDIAPAQFNNSRVHRALDALDRGRDALQERLPTLPDVAAGGFRTMYLDPTDTWFEGHGPPAAALSRTKEGHYRICVGIVLLCDQRGYPLRWTLTEGGLSEKPVLEAFVTGMQDLTWAQQGPLVVDRAMGPAAQVEFLVNSGLHFITAPTVSEYASYVQLPAVVAEIDLEMTDEDSLDRIEAAAKKLGWRATPSGSYVADLGIIERSARRSGARSAQIMRFARRVWHEFEAGRRVATISESHGIGKSKVHTLLSLRRMLPGLQQAVIDERLPAAMLNDLLAIADLPHDKQLAAFTELERELKGRPPLRCLKTYPGAATWSVRVIGAFSPERCIRQRSSALRVREDVETYVRDLNKRLRSSRRGTRAIRREVDDFLRKRKSRDLYDVDVQGPTPKRGWPRVKLVFQEEVWARRCQNHGFMLLVAHRDLEQSAEELLALYTHRDVVEKGFQTIKSTLELRPVQHRTDRKVRAHVDLCMLALLLQRALEARLSAAGVPMTAKAATEVLETCHLNELALPNQPSLLHMTALTSEQRELLAALGLAHVDQEPPRPPV